MKVSKNWMSVDSLSVLRNGGKSSVLGRSVMILTLLIFLVPCLAAASKERYVIDFGDRHISKHKGARATIFLKKSLKEQYPWLDLNKSELRKVVLVARSRNGRGAVQFRVGDWLTGMHPIKGSSHSFTKRPRVPFDRIAFHHPTGKSRGPWQLHLKGNVIIRKVIVEIENPKWRQHHRRWSYNW